MTEQPKDGAPVGEPLTAVSGGDLFSFCCLVCCGGCFGLAFLGALVAYIVFGIMFLVKDRYVCGNISPLWVFGISYWVVSAFSALFTCCLGCCKAPPTDIKGRMEGVTTQASSTFIFTVGLFIYESIILYSPHGYVCESMKHTGLMTWSWITWYMLLIASFGSLITLCLIGNLPPEVFLPPLPESDPLMVCTYFLS